MTQSIKHISTRFNGGPIPFEFEGVQIRVVTDANGEPLFVGKDVCVALGYSNFSDAMSTHCRGVAKRYPIVDSLGRSQDARVLSEPDVLRLIVNCTLPAAQAFERLIFEEILPTIRKTGSYSAKPKNAPNDTIEATKLFKPFFQIARLIGCDKPAAAISANQAVQSVAGKNLLALLGQTHLAAENQESAYFTPTQIGQEMGISNRKVNQLLADSGLQFKQGDAWVVLDAGKQYSRIYDTGKKHGSGVPVQQIKWTREVISVLNKQGIEA